MMSKIKTLYSAFLDLYKFFYNTFLSYLLFRTFKVYWSNHLTIGMKYLKKQKTNFPHPVGIVIGYNVTMGTNCVIYQNVTIGTKNTKDYKNASYPRVGNNVTIYANSVVFGDITIGDNAVIGASCVVFEDVPPDAVVAGNPARIVKLRT